MGMTRWRNGADASFGLEVWYNLMLLADILTLGGAGALTEPINMITGVNTAASLAQEWDDPEVIRRFNERYGECHPFKSEAEARRAVEEIKKEVAKLRAEGRLKPKDEEGDRSKYRLTPFETEGWGPANTQAP